MESQPELDIVKRIPYVYLEGGTQARVEWRLQAGYHCYKSPVNGLWLPVCLHADEWRPVHNLPSGARGFWLDPNKTRLWRVVLSNKYWRTTDHVLTGPKLRKIVKASRQDKESRNWNRPAAKLNGTQVDMAGKTLQACEPQTGKSQADKTKVDKAQVDKTQSTRPGLSGNLLSPRTFASLGAWQKKPTFLFLEKPVELKEESACELNQVTKAGEPKEEAASELNQVAEATEQEKIASELNPMAGEFVPLRADQQSKVEGLNPKAVEFVPRSLMLPVVAPPADDHPLKDEAHNSESSKEFSSFVDPLEWSKEEDLFDDDKNYENEEEIAHQPLPQVELRQVLPQPPRALPQLQPMPQEPRLVMQFKKPPHMFLGQTFNGEPCHEQVCLRHPYHHQLWQVRRCIAEQPRMPPTPVLDLAEWQGQQRLDIQRNQFGATSPPQGPYMFGY